MRRERDRDRFDTEFSVKGDAASVVITRAIASIEGIRTSDITCLNDVLASDELDTLIECDGSIEIRFPYEKYEVTVRGDGSLTIEERK